MSITVSRRSFLSNSALLLGGTLGGLSLLGAMGTTPAKADEAAARAEAEYISYLKTLSDEELAVASLEEDGYWGQATTLMFQSYVFHYDQFTYVTGYIENQWEPNIAANPGLLRSTWRCNTSLAGDPLISWIQQSVGTTQDGILGTDTVRGMQAKVGTYVDGVLSAGSSCIRQIQNNFNNILRPWWH